MITRTYNSVISCISDRLGADHDVEEHELDSEEVRGAVRELFDGVDDYRLLPLDGHYWTTTRSSFREIVRRDLTNWRRYQSDRYDCVDFTVAFQAAVQEHYQLNAVGRVISYDESTHMFNAIVAIDEDGEPVAEIYEPQRGSWLGFSETGRDLLWSDGAHGLEGAHVEI